MAGSAYSVYIVGEMRRRSAALGKNDKEFCQFVRSSVKFQDFSKTLIDFQKDSVTFPDMENFICIFHDIVGTLTTLRLPCCDVSRVLLPFSVLPLKSLFSSIFLGSH